MPGKLVAGYLCIYKLVSVDLKLIRYIICYIFVFFTPMSSKLAKFNELFMGQLKYGRSKVTRPDINHSGDSISEGSLNDEQ